ncbi:IS66 family transposase [Caldimonas brevitalea]|nr:IS66 family transposase [Caldimonas brevitalea]
MRQRIEAMNAEHARQIAERDEAIKYKDAKLQKVSFELARLKAWKFGAKTEAMNAEQRRLFEETVTEDEADLQAQLDALHHAPAPDATEPADKHRPRRLPLPDHLRRVEHRHEPDDTNCPAPGCGRPMVRIGEDVRERLDIVPAEFFVHRHVRGKWACKCCQILVQQPVEPQIIDKGMPAPGLLAHTLVSRFVDHLPYYRQQEISARCGVHTPRATLAAWSGAAGAGLEPLFEARKAFVLGCRVLHADETPVAMLDPGAGKTKRAYVWGYARSEFDAQPGVVYDFCVGRGSKYPVAFLKDWNGTLVCDDYKGYETLFKLQGRTEAGCLVHARRKFDELIKHGHSEVAAEAIRRMAWIFKLEKDARDCNAQERLAVRQSQTQLHWDELHAWLQRERQRVPDGSGIAGAIDYSLNRWAVLGRFLRDGEVSSHNNHLENLLRPWAMGRKAWLFAGSELDGQRAAIVMSLVQSAKLKGHDPWAYLKDVLTRLPTHPNQTIEELLPHNWGLQPLSKHDGKQS